MKAFSISIEMMMVLCVSKMSHAEIIAYKVYLSEDGCKNKVFFPYLESLIILEEILNHKLIIQLRPQVNHAPNGLFYVLLFFVMLLLVTVISFYI